LRSFAYHKRSSSFSVVVFDLREASLRLPREGSGETSPDQNIKSDLAIVPTRHAKRLFVASCLMPPSLRVDARGRHRLRVEPDVTGELHAVRDLRGDAVFLDEKVPEGYGILVQEPDAVF